MTILEIKSKVTPQDMKSRSVWVQTNLTNNPYRLVKIGRKFVSVLSEGQVKIIDPIIIKEIRM